MPDEVEVKIDGLPLVSGDEWAKAQSAPEEELPQVDPDRYITSRRLGIPVVEDARLEYAWELARQRMQRQGQVLAIKLGEFSGFPLRYVVWDGSRREWIAVPDKSSLRPVSIKPELVNRITGWGTQQDFEELGKLFAHYGVGA
ncbi:MAG: hypothetical protein ABSB60_13950 [Terracidiphilus sp.]|jgi:hypothetical protein